VCAPELLDESTCSDEKNYHKYIENFICTNSETSWKIKNMRLSFPSGHTSSAFAVAIYISIYVQSRITWRGSKLFKHILQMLFIAAAAFVGFTRISDYAHHWSDVLASSIMGTLIGVVSGIFITDLFKTKKIAEQKI
jgi:phosphatidate phosphatase